MTTGSAGPPSGAMAPISMGSELLQGGVKDMQQREHEIGNDSRRATQSLVDNTTTAAKDVSPAGRGSVDGATKANV